jgi:hypothetical protein
MSKRAKYLGSSAVRVTWPPGAVNPDQQWIIQPLGELPDDAPAALRDELLAHPEGLWSEYNRADSSSKTDADSKETS